MEPLEAHEFYRTHLTTQRTKTYSFETVCAEIRREIDARRRVYPRLIMRNQLSPQQAAAQTAKLEQALAWLEQRHAQGELL